MNKQTPKNILVASYIRLARAIGEKSGQAEGGEISALQTEISELALYQCLLERVLCEDGENELRNVLDALTLILSEAAGMELKRVASKQREAFEQMLRLRPWLTTSTIFGAITTAMHVECESAQRTCAAHDGNEVSRSETKQLLTEVLTRMNALLSLFRSDGVGKLQRDKMQLYIEGLKRELTKLGNRLSEKKFFEPSTAVGGLLQRISTLSSDIKTQKGGSADGQSKNSI